ncbi:AtpZ/AtpI family protein [Salipaludibacillus agaradhaerens]|uniref:AtpZ/AtpI family protein n=1 Tax=Salipaludibacillus agaradhaerens TaxID=76935 RepID=UPI000996646C|nr:AtpZ/AtpI family protein [Salipaludibacillus agaradhaerens]MCR6108233.1 AtpZ/AtpI family protein [Salipaludibacillus agaradhaerens]MCR6120258.1 AtpZ/AtpI family protein [Salipaludibacillus agaradhaerens]UJW59278.1 AtpZ/AtpI family protein [Bacillus sp. A116_S68]
MTRPSKQRQFIRAFALMSTLTSYIVGAVLLSVFGGRWLDQRFDGGGLYLVISLLAGFITAAYGIVKAVQQFMGDDSS